MESTGSDVVLPLRKSNVRVLSAEYITLLCVIEDGANGSGMLSFSRNGHASNVYPPYEFSLCMILYHGI